MLKKMRVTLTPVLAKEVRDRVKSGEYASESEVICEALRRMDEVLEAARLYRIQQQK